jgi:hypothetical protein
VYFRKICIDKNLISKEKMFKMKSFRFIVANSRKIKTLDSNYKVSSYDVLNDLTNEVNRNL